MYSDTSVTGLACRPDLLNTAGSSGRREVLAGTGRCGSFAVGV